MKSGEVKRSSTLGCRLEGCLPVSYVTLMNDLYSEFNHRLCTNPSLVVDNDYNSNFVFGAERAYLNIML